MEKNKNKKNNNNNSSQVSADKKSLQVGRLSGTLASLHGSNLLRSAE